MEKISVIVPVYMSEAYLEKCLDSILQQTYQNLEVILIMMAQLMVRQLFVSDIKIKMRVLKFTISQMEELLPVAIVPWKL